MLIIDTILISHTHFYCDKTITVMHITVDAYEPQKKVAYLTFDDGPSNRTTPKILDILEEYDIQASFFLIGCNAEKYPEIVKREYEEGHFIGNHTYSHNNQKIYSSKETFLNEIQMTDNAIKKILGINDFSCKIFRFPNGSAGNAYKLQKKKCFDYLDEIGYKYVDWNALNNDSIKKYSREELLSNLKNTVKGKNTVIILMHDSGDVNKTYDVLEDSIKYLRREGYDFRTLEDFAR